MPRAVSAVVRLRALRPDPGVVRAARKVLTGSKCHLRSTLVPKKIQVRFLALPQIFCKSLGKRTCAPVTL